MTEYYKILIVIIIIVISIIAIAIIIIIIIFIVIIVMVTDTCSYITSSFFLQHCFKNPLWTKYF